MKSHVGGNAHGEEENVTKRKRILRFTRRLKFKLTVPEKYGWKTIFKARLMSEQLFECTRAGFVSFDHQDVKLCFQQIKKLATFSIRNHDTKMLRHNKKNIHRFF